MVDWYFTLSDFWSTVVLICLGIVAIVVLFVLCGLLLWVEEAPQRRIVEKASRNLRKVQSKLADHETMETTRKYRARILAFAVNCAHDELDCFAQAASHPDTSPGFGGYQSFVAEFPNATDGDRDLFAEVYEATVRTVGARRGIEVL